MRKIRNTPKLVIGTGSRAIRTDVDNRYAPDLIRRSLGKLPRSRPAIKEPAPIIIDTSLPARWYVAQD